MHAAAKPVVSACDDLMTYTSQYDVTAAAATRTITSISISVHCVNIAVFYNVLFPFSIQHSSLSPMSRARPISQAKT